MTRNLKELWGAGETAVNGWLAVPSAYSAEVMAQSGWDTLTIDMQHGIHDYFSVVACLQSTQPHGLPVLVRVPWNEPGIIGRVLDAGAHGVICPMVNTRADAESFVKAVRYPPQGCRSHGPARAGLYGVTGTYYKTANGDVICMPMIETEEAVENIGEILDVPGIDGIYVGPGDLGFSIGLPPSLDREEVRIMQFYDVLLEACNKRGIYAGLHTLTSAYALRMAEMGFRFVSILNDAGLMQRAARVEVESFRASRPHQG